MYTMTVDGRLLYDPRLDDYALQKPTLTQDANKIASLPFAIYPNHPEYSGIQKMRSIISVYQDGNLIMKLRAVNSKLNFRGGIDYRCEELAARLNDIRRRPGYFEGTAEEYLEELLSEFNTRYEGSAPSYSGYTNYYVPLIKGITGHKEDVQKLQSNLLKLGYRMHYGADGVYGDETEYTVRCFQRDNHLQSTGQFTQTDKTIMDAIFADTPAPPTTAESFFVGTVAGISTDEIEFINDDYVGYWDLMQEKLVGQLGGYLIPRYTTSGIYIDYLDDDNLPPSAQDVVFGENLADLFMENDAAKTFSVLIPLGADVKATGIHEGQAKNTPLTIAAVEPNGHDYLVNEYALNLYGRRETPYRWDDVDDASTLMALGEAFLSEHSGMLKDSITLNAVDLRDTGVDVQAMRWMTRVHISDELHRINEIYPLTYKQTPLGAPSTARIKIGNTRETLTDRISDNATRATQAYNTLNGKVFNIENPDT